MDSVHIYELDLQVQVDTKLFFLTKETIKKLTGTINVIKVDDFESAKLYLFERKVPNATNQNISENPTKSSPNLNPNK